MSKINLKLTHNFNILILEVGSSLHIINNICLVNKIIFFPLQFFFSLFMHK